MAEAPMNLPDEVIEEAWRAMKGPRYRMVDTRAFAELESAAPVIADYAYRKGREDALTEARVQREEIERRAVEFSAWLAFRGDLADAKEAFRSETAFGPLLTPEAERRVLDFQSPVPLHSLAGEEECRRCGGDGVDSNDIDGNPHPCDRCGGTGKERTNG